MNAYIGKSVFSDRNAPMPDSLQQKWESICSQRLQELKRFVSKNDLGLSGKVFSANVNGLIYSQMYGMVDIN